MKSLRGYLMFGLIFCSVFRTEASFSQTARNAKSRPATAMGEIEKTEASDTSSFIQWTNERLQNRSYRNEQDCADCLASSAGTENSSLNAESPHSICKRRWDSFYRSEPKNPANPAGGMKPTDLRIVFGYIDSDDDDISGDLLARQAMIDQVTSPCEASGNNVAVCGFKRDTYDADVFEKNVTAPDGHVQPVRLRLVASSATGLDSKNRVSKNGEPTAAQKRASERAEEAYYGGIAESKMLLYVGHAREAGGPDFRPSLRRPNGSIDYDYYRRVQPGLNRLTAVLAMAEKKPDILGFFSCDSERWDARISRAAPKSGLLVTATPKMQTSATLAQAYATLDSVLSQRCEESFNAAINLVNFHYNSKRDAVPVVPIQIKNFFR